MRTNLGSVKTLLLLLAFAVFAAPADAQRLEDGHTNGKIAVSVTSFAEDGTQGFAPPVSVEGEGPINLLKVDPGGLISEAMRGVPEMLVSEMVRARRFDVFDASRVEAGSGDDAKLDLYIIKPKVISITLINSGFKVPVPKNKGRRSPWVITLQLVSMRVVLSVSAIDSSSGKIVFSNRFTGEVRFNGVEVSHKDIGSVARVLRVRSINEATRKAVRAAVAALASNLIPLDGGNSEGVFRRQ